MKYTAALMAAGRGSRTHLDYNKVFYHLGSDRTVLDASLDVFLSDPECAQILVVAAEYEVRLMEDILQGRDSRIEVVSGGATRQESVWNALQKVREDVVFIHDAARPYLKPEQIYDLKQAMKTEKAALLMVPAVDTIKTVDENGYVVETLPRKTVWHAQTPQVFRTDLIRRCHEAAREKNVEATDDAQLVELFGKTPVLAVEGDPSNTKITNPSDLKYSFDLD